MTILLHGMAMCNYRGAGEDYQYIGSFSQVNFLIGENNSGKSIVLNVLHEQLHRLFSEPLNLVLDAVNVHKGSHRSEIGLGIGLLPEKIKERMIPHPARTSRDFGIGSDQFAQAQDTIVRALTSHANLVWLGYDHESMKARILPAGLTTELAKLNHALAYLVTPMYGGSFKGSATKAAEWLVETLAKPTTDLLPEIRLIPAKRQIEHLGEQPGGDLDGKLIRMLASHQNPKVGEDDKEILFAKIVEFVREVLEDDDVLLQVPSEHDGLIIKKDGKRLPLSSFGTGIHEVVVIAAYCTIYSNCIMCLEEPEIHLHPTLQRRLIHYLKTQTQNQYFIATHSAALIDAEDTSVFHVINDGVQTKIKKVDRARELRATLDNLGYRASDLLQANFIIWVEGPTERIYLRHWLMQHSKLREGVDFTIMFYGGALLAHLTCADVDGEDDSFQEFIELIKINPKFAILMDSDKTKESSELKPHVRRVQDELSDSGVLCWVTEGREIENYIEPGALHKAISKIHSNIYGKPYRTKKFANAYKFWRKDGKISSGTRKVKVAEEVCKREVDLNVLDLHSQLDKLAHAIRLANGKEI